MGKRERTRERRGKNRREEIFASLTILSGDVPSNSGKEIQKRGAICVYVADPLCYTAETNTTL